MMSFAGKSLVEISEAMQIPNGTVAAWSANGKWKVRRLAMQNRPTSAEEEAKKTIEQEEAAAKEIAALDAMSFSERQEYYRDKAALIACRAARAMSNLDDISLLKSAGDIVKLDTFARKGLDLEKGTPVVVANVVYLSQPLLQPSATPAAALPAPAEQLVEAREVEATVTSLDS